MDTRKRWRWLSFAKVIFMPPVSTNFTGAVSSCIIILIIVCVLFVQVHRLHPKQLCERKRATRVTEIWVSNWQCFVLFFCHFIFWILVVAAAGVIIVDISFIFIIIMNVFRAVAMYVCACVCVCVSTSSFYSMISEIFMVKRQFLKQLLPNFAYIIWLLLNIQSLSLKATKIWLWVWSLESSGL